MALDLAFTVSKPMATLSKFVDSFWMLKNNSDKEQEIIVLPDGRIDIMLSYTPSEPFHILLMGLDTEPSKTTFTPGTVIFAISLKLLGVSYLLDTSTSVNINSPQLLPPDFWDFSAADLEDFTFFCEKANKKLNALLPTTIDSRKEKLFDLIYDNNGAMPIKEMAAQAFWSSRQINRYFHQQFGLTLKAYCSILRFRASFAQLKEGKLFPEQGFADQAHFIKEVKKLSGALPKELFKNQNDRFIQFSTMHKK